MKYSRFRETPAGDRVRSTPRGGRGSLCVPEQHRVPSGILGHQLQPARKTPKLHLCQHVICHNPARLPSPAEWVNVQRIRLKDSFTHVWWMSRSKNPKADNRNVLNPYGKDMKKLLRTKHYNSGTRPSGHVISEKGFLTDHGGSISANVIELDSSNPPDALLKYTGTSWDQNYRE